MSISNNAALQQELEHARLLARAKKVCAGDKKDSEELQKIIDNMSNSANFFGEESNMFIIGHASFVQMAKESLLEEREDVVQEKIFDYLNRMIQNLSTTFSQEGPTLVQQELAAQSMRGETDQNPSSNIIIDNFVKECDLFFDNTNSNNNNNNNGKNVLMSESKFEELMQSLHWANNSHVEDEEAMKKTVFLLFEKSCPSFEEEVFYIDNPLCLIPSPQKWKNQIFLRHEKLTSIFVQIVKLYYIYSRLNYNLLRAIFMNILHPVPFCEKSVDKSILQDILNLDPYLGKIGFLGYDLDDSQKVEDQNTRHWCFKTSLSTSVRNMHFLASLYFIMISDSFPSNSIPFSFPEIRRGVSCYPLTFKSKCSIESIFTSVITIHSKEMFHISQIRKSFREIENMRTKEMGKLEKLLGRNKKDQSDEFKKYLWKNIAVSDEEKGVIDQNMSVGSSWVSYWPKEFKMLGIPLLKYSFICNLLGQSNKEKFLFFVKFSETFDDENTAIARRNYREILKTWGLDTEEFKDVMMMARENLKLFYVQYPEMDDTPNIIAGNATESEFLEGTKIPMLLANNEESISIFDSLNDIMREEEKMKESGEKRVTNEFSNNNPRKNIKKPKKEKESAKVLKWAKEDAKQNNYDYSEADIYTMYYFEHNPESSNLTEYLENIENTIQNHEDNFVLLKALIEQCNYYPTKYCAQFQRLRDYVDKNFFN